MSKSLPPLALAITFLGAACEPVSAPVAQVVAPLNDAGDVQDDRVRVVDAAAMDAGVADAAKGAKSDGAALGVPTSCVTLLDRAFDVVGTGSSDGTIEAINAAAAGCANDAGAKLFTSSLFSREDGEPIVERGQRYSYRWSADTAMTRVNLVGGKDRCEDQTIVQHDNPIAKADNGFQIATCYEFVAPIDAKFLRTTGGDYYPLGWVTGNASFQLCRAPCPPGTSYPDAGVQDAGALDAGGVVPGIPPLPSVPSVP
jgi:hypothetical protein